MIIGKCQSDHHQLRFSYDGWNSEPFGTATTPAAHSGAYLDGGQHSWNIPSLGQDITDRRNGIGIEIELGHTTRCLRHVLRYWFSVRKVWIIATKVWIPPCQGCIELSLDHGILSHIIQLRIAHCVRVGLKLFCKLLRHSIRDPFC